VLGSKAVGPAGKYRAFKDVIRILERLKHFEPAGARRASLKYRFSDECEQAGQIALAQSNATSPSAVPTVAREAKQEPLQ
jgi:hypothetical protein